MFKSTDIPTISSMLMTLLIAILSIAMLSCSDDRDERDLDDDDDDDTDTGDYDTGPDEPEGCISMDIVFVIDNSGSMNEEQTNLANNFPVFIEVLDDYTNPSGEHMEYRVAVTTTDADIPTAGEFVGQAECGLGSNPWVDGPADDVVTKFACMAAVGTSGSGQEKPFVTVQEALGAKAESGQINNGFYRENQASLLVVVIITDEDDRSEVLAAEVKDFLTALTGGQNRYVVVGIAGPQMCSSTFGDAEEAIKIKELIDLVEDNGFFGDICEGDLSGSLADALEVMQATCDDFGVE